MDQVLAISNETAISYDSSGTKVTGRSSDDFELLLEKEKSKILTTLYLPLLRSMNLQDINTGFKLDEKVGKIEKRAETNNDINKETAKVSQNPRKIESSSQKNEAKSQAVQSAKIEKARDLTFTSGAVKKIFIGQIELDQEFYGNLKIANDGIASLKGIDLTELISQIKDKIKLMKDNGRTELTIALKPDDLGSILMSITSNKGVLSIMIYADKAAKQTLDENITDLETSLKQANLNVGSLSVLADGSRKNNNREYLNDILYNNAQES